MCCKCEGNRFRQLESNRIINVERVTSRQRRFLPVKRSWRGEDPPSQLGQHDWPLFGDSAGLPHSALRRTRGPLQTFNVALAVQLISERVVVRTVALVVPLTAGRSQGGSVQTGNWTGNCHRRRKCGTGSNVDFRFSPPVQTPAPNPAACPAQGRVAEAVA